MLIPLRDRGLELLSDERRDRFLEHMAAVRERMESGDDSSMGLAPEVQLDPEQGKTTDSTSSGAPAVPTQADSQPVESDPVVGAVCGTCKGVCCHHGNGHAFLDPPRLRRALQQDPSLTIERLFERYVEAIPERSVAGSCVFHGERGCALPRDWRADICNHYVCAGLKRAQGLAREGKKQLFVVTRHDNEVIRWKFVSAGPDEAD